MDKVNALPDPVPLLIKAGALVEHKTDNDTVHFGRKKPMNEDASKLGKLAAGKPKKYTRAEIAKRTARLRKAQKKRAKTQRESESSSATAGQKRHEKH